MPVNSLIQVIVNYLQEKVAKTDFCDPLVTSKYSVLHQKGVTLSVRVRSISTLRDNYSCPQRRVFVSVVIISPRTDPKELYRVFEELDGWIKEMTDETLHKADKGFARSEIYLDTGPIQTVALPEGTAGLELNTSFSVDHFGHS